jgi:hypothetical protein
MGDEIEAEQLSYIIAQNHWVSSDYFRIVKGLKVRPLS